MNKHFTLKKQMVQIYLVIFEKNMLQLRKNNLNRSKATNNQLNCEQVKSQFQAFGNHLIKMVSESLKLTLTC